MCYQATAKEWPEIKEEPMEYFPLDFSPRHRLTNMERNLVSKVFETVEQDNLQRSILKTELDKRQDLYQLHKTLMERFGVKYREANKMNVNSFHAIRRKQKEHAKNKAKCFPCYIG